MSIETFPLGWSFLEVERLRIIRKCIGSWEEVREGEERACEKKENGPLQLFIPV